MGCINVCACNNTMSNTGTECTPLIEVTRKVILVPTYNSDGVRNFIDLTDTLDASYLTERINDVDASKRWFPLPNMKDIHDVRNDAIYEDFPDRSQAFIADGTRLFDGIIVGRDGNPVLKSKIESARCVDMSVFLIDRKGSMVGVISSDGTQMFPIRLDSDSISANYIKTTDTTIQKLLVKFNFSPDESDNCLRMITADEWTTANLLAAKGLTNVYGVPSNISTTGFKLQLITEYGTPINPVTVKGLVVADFVSVVTAATSKVRNVTDNADVTITSVTEDTTNEGTYTFVFVAQGTGEVIKVDAVKTGYDFTAVAALDITIP